MTDVERTRVPYVNCLEPQNLLSSFQQYPPRGFVTARAENGVFSFDAPFDLLTTMDDDIRRKVISKPGYRWWKGVLTLSSRFIGTTVSEYSPFPKNSPPAELVKSLVQLANDKTMTIIKDVPHNSPLLSAGDNFYSQQLYDECIKQGFIGVEGQALAYVAVNFSDTDEYLARMSHSRRRNIRRKLRSLDKLRVDVVATGDPRFENARFNDELYQLYLAVYQQSDIHFDLLTPDFFNALLKDANSGGQVFFYWHEEVLVGYNICYQHEHKLIDKYIGMNYPLAQEFNLYFVSWFVNLDYALKNGLRFYVAGWTDPQVKASLGASFTFTRHLVWVRNPLLRRILYRFRHYFEADAQWHHGEKG